MSLPLFKFTGKMIGTLVGTILSPFWALFSMVMRDYFDLQKATQGPLAMMAEFNRFTAFIDLNPDLVLFQVFPKICLVLLLSGLFVAGFTWWGGWAGQTLATRWQNQSNPA